MFLIIGIPSESPVKFLTDACDGLGLKYYVLSQRRQASWTLTIDHVNYANSVIRDDEGDHDFRDFSGIYVRAMDHTQVPEYKSESTDRKRIDDTIAGLFNLFDVIQGPRVVSRPSAMQSNNSKPFQSQIIRSFGLDVPATCVTNDPAKALEFIEEYQQVIYKSISGTRSIVKQADADSLRRLEKIRYCPVQFQEFVTGFNVRVHVVNDTAIATRIHTDSVDYRYAHTEQKETTLEAFDLDILTANKCVLLSKAMGLPFCGIDLMFADDGRTICFEVNPSPGYSYYESHTGQQISVALARYLDGG